MGLDVGKLLPQLVLIVTFRLPEDLVPQAVWAHVFHVQYERGGACIMDKLGHLCAASPLASLKILFLMWCEHSPFMSNIKEVVPTLLVSWDTCEKPVFLLFLMWCGHSPFMSNIKEVVHALLVSWDTCEEPVLLIITDEWHVPSTRL